MSNYTKSLIILVVGLLLTFSTVTFGFANDMKPTQKVRVVKVIDGDSIEVNNNGTLCTVRLYGIDSPEWQQPYSRRAKVFLEKHLLGRDVLLESFYIDKFNRNVALVYFQGKTVNQLLLKEGLAWVHIYYCHKKICESWKILERTAKTNRVGLWQEESPVPPWVWKRRRR